MMKLLRNILDRVETFFEKGSKLERLYPVFEVIDTFFYTPGDKTRQPCHVRDAIDFKRMMSAVLVALLPCVVMAMYNTGLQANTAMEQMGLTVADGWRGALIGMTGIGFDPANIVANLLHGALYFLPIYIVTMAVGIGWEMLFSVVRGHAINEGFFVTGLLFPLILPASIPLWQVALAISFGVVVGKEIFGGTGRNFLNPALTARAFLFFAYATGISGNSVWTPVDGFSGATPLAVVAEAEIVQDSDGNMDVMKSLEAVEIKGKVFERNSETGEFMINSETGEKIVARTETWTEEISLQDSFMGNIQGSMGETSTLACLIGAGLLMLFGVGSWRIMLSMLLGAVALSGVLFVVGSDTNSMFGMPPHWHLVLGGFAFGLVFMATDPVSATITNLGQYIYGALIGVMVIVVRVFNPGFPEGTMLAILFGNVFAPLIDYYVVRANIKRRIRRNA
jgi:Na+-transporting NADH:ubiquinone oxidoreductase subunit B